MNAANVAYGWVYRLTLGLFVVLVVTGALLWFWFRPVFVPLEALADVPGDVRFSYRLNQVHRVSALTFCAAATATGVLALLRNASALALRVLLSLFLSVGAVGGLLSGQQLPWQQLGIRSADRNVKGYQWLFSDDVLFISVGDRVVSAGFLAGWLFLHIAVVGFGVVVCFVGLRPARTDLAHHHEAADEEWDLGYVPLTPPVLDEIGSRGE